MTFHSLRSLALGAVTLAALAPAAFAASNSDYENCISRDKPNNGGLSCEVLRDKGTIETNAFAVQADTMDGKKPVYLFDTWPGKSTK